MQTLYLSLGGYRTIAGPIVVCFTKVLKPLSNQTYFETIIKDKDRVHDWKRVSEKVNKAFDDGEFEYFSVTNEASDLDGISIYEIVKKAFLKALLHFGLDINCTLNTVQKGIPKISNLYNLNKVALDNNAEGMLSKAVSHLEFRNQMLGIHDRYPIYDFNKTWGMPNRKHLDSVLSNGPCVHHRTSSIKKMPNWVVTRADRAKDSDERRFYLLNFIHTKIWWGKYNNYQISMYEALTKKSQFKLHQVFTREMFDIYRPVSTEMENWNFLNAPSEEDALFLQELKIKEDKRWKAYIRDYLQSHKDVARMSNQHSRLLSTQA